MIMTWGWSSRARSRRILVGVFCIFGVALSAVWLASRMLVRLASRSVLVALWEIWFVIFLRLRGVGNGDFLMFCGGDSCSGFSTLEYMESLEREATAFMHPVLRVLE